MSSAEKKPCKPCSEKSTITYASPDMFNDSKALRESPFYRALTPLLRDGARQVEGGVDPVVAAIVLRRRIGFEAERWEKCGVCRRDIVMAEDFDQYMVNAKQTRLTWVQGQRLQAAKMYWAFQKSVLRGVLKWVLGI
jgi:hypothetical protein